jgi:hypothetical protein
MNKFMLSFGRSKIKMPEQELLQRLVIEVRAKNGMAPSRMNRALERLEKTGTTPEISQS